MEQVVVAAVLVVLAAGVAFLLRRRLPQPPTQPRWEVPSQLDRADFVAPERPWLVVVFTSATCQSCAEATAKAALLEGPEVGYQEVPYQTARDLHRRYGVEIVPMTIVADEEGIVRASFIGAPPAADLWAAVAEVRQPPAQA